MGPQLIYLFHQQLIKTLSCQIIETKINSYVTTIKCNKLEAILQLYGYKLNFSVSDEIRLYSKLWCLW